MQAFLYILAPASMFSFAFPLNDSNARFISPSGFFFKFLKTGIDNKHLFEYNKSVASEMHQLNTR